MAQGRKFAVFDIDGTLIRWQLFHAVTDALAQRGHIKPRSYQVMRDARQAWKRRSGGGFKDYETQVVGIYEAVLKTLTVEQFESAADAVFEEYKDQIYTYTRDLIAKLKKQGYLLFAISGSQTEVVAKIADYYKFDDYVGTVYGRAGQGFSGSKKIGSFNKDKTLKRLVAKHNVSFEDSIGIGDSRGDIAMLELVDQPIAFNPERALFKHAQNKGWKVIVERKNMVYELEEHDGKYQLAKTS
ncbi:MAG TPA: HAD family phosphatase [Candidatus Saccharimonadales bacterium]|nr:HAD family phosphatase [Candidatus Saccharimonadales bacterium]